MIRAACALVLALLVLVAGCGKKKDAYNSNSSVQVAGTASTERNAQPQHKDSADIFDEFYNDNKSKNQGATTPLQSSVPAPAKNVISSGTSVAVSGNASVNDIDPNGRYVVQVACEKTKDLADVIVMKLKAKGIPAFVSEVVNPTSQLIGTYYRVRVGGFSGISVANAFRHKFLDPEGYPSWVGTKDDAGNGGIGIVGTKEPESAKTVAEPAPAAKPAPVSEPPASQAPPPVEASAAPVTQGTVTSAASSPPPAAATAPAEQAAAQQAPATAPVSPAATTPTASPAKQPAVSDSTW